MNKLDDNGGKTQTCALLSDSPAIDVIPDSEVFSDFDQRGALRRKGGFFTNVLADIGAFEF